MAVDAGSLAFALTTEEMCRVRHILISHAHVDHTASLPVFIAETLPALTAPVIVHAIPGVIETLQRCVFNGEMWPDFTRIRMRDNMGPPLEFCSLKPGAPASVGHLRATPVLVNHVVPTTGFLIQDHRVSVAITSDTYATDEFWAAAKRLDGLQAIIVDVSYPDEMHDLAVASKHFTPRSLAADLKKLGRDVPIYAVHIKPSHRDCVIRQLHELGDPRISVLEIGRTYEW